MAISINLYLDCRFSKKDNQSEEQEFPIKVTITKDEATAYLSTGVKVFSDQWSGGSERIPHLQSDSGIVPGDLSGQGGPE